MSFATEITKPNSYRGCLVRMLGARDVTTQLASLGGNEYSYVFEGPVTIAGVYRNDTAFTLQDDVGSVNANLEYFYDSSTYTLTVNTTTAPDIDATLIIVKYYLFFSDSSAVTKAYETPTDANSSVRYWDPRIVGGITVGQDVTNLVSGIFSLSLSTLSLANTDRSLNRWLSPYDSFFQKSVDFFFWVNDPTIVSRAFQGCVTAVGIADDRIAFTLDDAFSRLKQTAYMGDTREEAVFSRESGAFPDMNPAQSGRPCRFIIGSSSRSERSETFTFPSGAPQSPITAYTAELQRSLPVLEEAVNTDFENIAGTSTNRTWGLCRIPSGTLKTQDLGSYVRYAVKGSIDHPVTIYERTSHNLRVGEVIRSTGTAPDPRYFVVKHDEAFTSSGSAYNLRIDQLNEPDNSFASNVTTFATGDYSVSLWVYRAEHNTITQLAPVRDFTVSLSTTSGGNQYVSVTLASNFEANYPYTGGVNAWTGALDANSDRIFYKVWLTGNTKSHGGVVQDLCELAGLTVNAASITAVDSALDVDCLFSIPMAGETDYGNYLDYCEAILKGTFGTLSLNSSGEAVYNLIAEPSSSTTRTADDTVNETFTATIEYEDIVSNTVFRNIHDNGPYAQASGAPFHVKDSASARYLHGINRSSVIEHVLEDISDRVDLIFKFRSNRRALYTFTTATMDLQTEITDDLQLENSNLLGTESSVDATVTSYRRSPNEVEIKLIDLKGDF